MAVRDPNSAAGISRVGRSGAARTLGSAWRQSWTDQERRPRTGQPGPTCSGCLRWPSVRTRLGRSAVGNAIHLRRPPTADLVLKRSGKGGGRLRFGLRPAWLRVRHTGSRRSTSGAWLKSHCCSAAVPAAVVSASRPRDSQRDAGATTRQG